YTDGEITEKDDQLRPYLEGAYRLRRDIYPIDHWDRGLGGTLGARAGDAKSWLEALDRGGVESAILYPTGGIAFGWIREPEFAVALAQAYNDFLHQEFLQQSPRLQGVALVPLQDVSEAVKELRRAVSELKVAGAMLNAVGLRLPLGHPDYWPVYAEAERLGCMVAVHATVRGPHYFAGELFDQFIEVHTLSHPFAQMIQMTSMVFRGVFEQFPNLRVAFMEAGGSENLLPQVAELLPDGLFYASDYPHWDSSFPHNIEEITEREDLSPQLKQKILADNACRMYSNLASPD